MAGDVINLRQARKGRLRAQKEQQAAENRVKFGRTKAERTAEEAEKAVSTVRLDGHKRDDGPADDGAS